MKKKWLVVPIFLFLFVATAAAAEKKVFFKNLHDGDKVVSPVRAEFGVDGMTLAKAGAPKPGEGHHHIIVDGGPIEAGKVVPADATHIHYGQAQTEAEIVLPPGKHTLTLQFADGLHQSYGKDMSATVAIEVVAPPSETKK